MKSSVKENKNEVVLLRKLNTATNLWRKSNKNEVILLGKTKTDLCDPKELSVNPHTFAFLRDNNNDYTSTQQRDTF